MRSDMLLGGVTTVKLKRTGIGVHFVKSYRHSPSLRVGEFFFVVRACENFHAHLSHIVRAILSHGRNEAETETEDTATG